MIDINEKSIGMLLRGEVGKVRPDLLRRGEKIRSQAGPNVRVEGNVGRTRYRVTVVTTSNDLDALRRAIGAGR